MLLDLSSLRKAILSLEQAIIVWEHLPNKDILLRQTVQAGVIQNFEFTYELSWKFIKRWLEEAQGQADIDGLTRQELFRRSAEHLLIEDPVRWMKYHKMRNQTSHTYDTEVAQVIAELAKPFLQDAKLLLKNLETHND